MERPQHTRGVPAARMTFALTSPSIMTDPTRRRILVIDDEGCLRKVFARLLRDVHEVAEQSSGRGALAAFEAGERFDAILCDLMMPGMSGMDLFARVAVLAPEQAARMIFVTGGAFTQEAADFLARVPNPRLEKPIHAATFRNLVAAVADGPLVDRTEPPRAGAKGRR